MWAVAMSTRWLEVVELLVGLILSCRGAQREAESLECKYLGCLPSALIPNTSHKLSTNGGPPGPVWRYAVHFRQPGPGVPPLVPALLER